MEKTIAQKLDALLTLQNIDSKLMSIKKVRGDLPEEVRDLEDEVAGYHTRLNKFKEEIGTLEEEIVQYKNRKKEAEKLIIKYKDQQENVRNNREYDAISKEVETEELEIVLSDKKSREADEKINRKKQEVKELERIIGEREKDLATKNSELSQISSESQDEEAKLLKEREKQTQEIEERLLKSYNKIRANAMNGLAVVMVKRDACGGCFNIVPPQRQVDIRDRKKLIVCEHCGRIFAGVEEVVVVEKVKK